MQMSNKDIFRVAAAVAAAGNMLCAIPTQERIGSHFFDAAFCCAFSAFRRFTSSHKPRPAVKQPNGLAEGQAPSCKLDRKSDFKCLELTCSHCQADHACCYLSKLVSTRKSRKKSGCFERRTAGV